MRNQNNTNGSFAGKGYYIALILCAIAIGVSGYLYYQNAGEPDPQLGSPTLGANATLPSGNHIQAVATEPSGTSPRVPKPTTPAKTKLNTCLPVEGQTVAVYAMDSLSYNPTTRDWRVHDGIDIAADAGSTVCAAADGTVYTVYEDDTMGTTVVIRHEGGYVTQYASLAKEVCVSPGQTVEMGQAIGTVGASALLESAIGDHVHFSVTCDGEPMDPNEFLEIE
jgi:murein DD-endopeptidase MepM/ murein hydrolase activator NlpD